jgi:hypothetical protein
MYREAVKSRKERIARGEVREAKRLEKKAKRLQETRARRR